MEETIKFLLSNLNSFSNRTLGDRLEAQGWGSDSWPTPQDVELDLFYPQSGVGAVVSFVEITVDQVHQNPFYYYWHDFNCLKFRAQMRAMHMSSLVELGIDTSVLLFSHTGHITSSTPHYFMATKTFEQRTVQLVFKIKVVKLSLCCFIGDVIVYRKKIGNHKRVS